MGPWKPLGGGWMRSVGSGTGGWLGGALAPGSDAPSPDPATEPSRPLRSRTNCVGVDAFDATDIREVLGVVETRIR